MHPVDYLFLFLLFVVQPIAGAIAYRRYLRRIRAGEKPDPLPFYRSTVLLEWLSLAVLFVAWLALGRPFANLGFVAPGGAGFWAGLAVLAAAGVTLFRSARNARRLTAKKKSDYALEFGDLVYFLPRNDEQLRYFYRVSVTAGVVEEIVFRGYAIWCLSAFMPLLAAVVVSSAAFGLAHSYQGAAGILRTGVIGLAFGLFYVVTGSIWLPIVGHALFDILQGKAIVEILREKDDRADSEVAAAACGPR